MWTYTKFYGVIYAPKATMTMWGYNNTSEFFGAIAANSVTVYPYSSSLLELHYDTALRSSSATYSQIKVPYTVPAGTWDEP